jgi:hypothetical protein
VVFLCAFAIGLGAMAQDAPKKKKKPATAGDRKAHHKPTKDQIRRFNELQKKQ